MAAPYKLAVDSPDDVDEVVAQRYHHFDTGYCCCWNGSVDDWGETSPLLQGLFDVDGEGVVGVEDCFHHSVEHKKRTWSRNRYISILKSNDFRAGFIFALFLVFLSNFVLYFRAHIFRSLLLR